MISLSGHAYRIVGVLKPWRFQPRVYDLTNRAFLDTEDIFLPYSTALANELWSAGGVWCNEPLSPQWQSRLNSECRWIEYWVELPTTAAVRDYRAFLVSYAQEQQRLGRFHWSPHVAIVDARQALRDAHMTPPGMRISVLAAFGFLLVCLFNATGLMLARLSGRMSEFSLRRALGASRLQIFVQCVADGGVVGLAGGGLSILVTLAGLAFEHQVLRDDYAQLIVVHGSVLAEALLLAVAAMTCAALYPAWSATRHSPAWRLATE